VSFYVKREAGAIRQATFRTFGCSACIAASSVATELLVGRVDGEFLSVDELLSALDGLPEDKRYCLDLVVEAARGVLSG
jgi:NifU-like protein involved in Fe-S cluster formation